MKRYRWLKANWPISMNDLAKRLKSRSFRLDQKEGFIIDRARDSFIEARFVQKLEYDDTVMDPFGSEVSLHRVEYRKCEFKATTTGPGLELVDAPRSVQTMVTRLAELSEFSLAISALSTDALAWVSNVRRSLDSVAVVDSIQIGALEIASGVRAKVAIKGNSDVLVAASNLVEGKKHVIEKVHVRFTGAHRKTLLLTNVGMARFDQPPTEEFLTIVRASLPH
jgi:hypothetical protein